MAGMGAGLYAAEPAYRAALDDCADRLRPELGTDLRDWLHGADAGVLAKTWMAQPALFALAYSLAQLWASWGVRPEALLGYGPGEYVATCLAGIFDLPDALRLVAARGRLSRAQPRGARRAVSAAQAEPLAELAARVALRPPQLAVVSSVTGTWLLPEEATDPLYWARQLWAPVRSGAGLATLLAEPDRVLLEVGPGEALVRLARQQPAAAGRVLVACLPRPTGTADEAWQVREALGGLWLAGVVVDWAAAGPAGQRVPLPPYPFERRRHWVESPPPESTGLGSVAPAWPSPADWLYVPALIPPIRAQG
jgi:phthiocerol/phenolphthiocerol synthesis type-I polyketide synthase E